MSTAVPRLALLVHGTKPEADEVAREVMAGAIQRGMEAVRLDREATHAPADTDLVVGIGGDGTLLEAAALAMEHDLPVVGVNLGNVGYLADIEPGMINQMLDGLLTRGLQVKHRMTVKASTEDGRSWLGINDLVVEKVMSQRLVQLDVAINEHYFTSYRADGLIVATPLGSTAYSLSAGGPVLDPALDALILTPVAPHSLLSRSIVLAPDAVLRLTVVLDRDVRVNLDGREAVVLGEGDSIVVTRGERPIRFLSLGGHPFPQAVRRQFGLDHA